MHITLTPIRHDAPLTLTRVGDTLTINGECFDFSDLPEGATLPRTAIDSPWFAGDVERTGGVLHLTVLAPHGAEAPDACRRVVTRHIFKDGAISLLPSQDEVEA